MGYEDPSGNYPCETKQDLYKEHSEQGYDATKTNNEQIQQKKNGNQLYSDEFLINAAYDIHRAQYGNAWWGKKNPVCVTQAADGTIVITKNRGVIGKKSRERARKIFGDNAIIVSGRGKNYDNSRWGYSTPEPSHAEARGIQALLSMGIDVTGARQATTLASCEYCTRLQEYFGINNLTGQRE